MSVYIDTLANLIEDERNDNEATREDFERAISLVFGPK